MTTPRLGLAEIQGNQANKHVTHNEALRTIDAWTASGVQDRDLDAPPASPAEGDLYLVSYAAFAIVAVDTTNNIVEVSGDQTGRISADHLFRIAGSTGNDGTYTVSTITYNSTSGNTEITTAEDLTDGTADGEIRHAGGAWNGGIDDVAQYDNGSWYLHAPFPGARVMVLDEGAELYWDPGAGSWLQVKDPTISYAPATTLTISAGEVTWAQTYHEIAGEGGGDDTLETINGGSEGDVAVLRPASGTIITLAHNVGNVWLKGGVDLDLTDPSDQVQLVRNASGYWTDVGAGGGGKVAPDPDTVALRDSGGRMKAAIPQASDDVARKAEVDAITTSHFDAAKAASPGVTSLVTDDRAAIVQAMLDANQVTAGDALLRHVLSIEPDVTDEGTGWTTSYESVGISFDQSNGDLVVLRDTGDVYLHDGWSSTTKDSFTADDLSGSPGGVSYKSSTGEVAVLDYTYGDVYVYDGFTGTILRSFGSSAYGAGLATDYATGDLLILDSDGIIRIHDGYTSTEKDAVDISSLTTTPKAIAVKKGNVYLYDATDDYVYKLDGYGPSYTQRWTTVVPPKEWEFDPVSERLSYIKWEADDALKQFPNKDGDTNDIPAAPGSVITRVLGFGDELRLVVAKQAWAITDVDTGGDTVKVSGDQTAVFAEGDSIDIVGSTGNDGTYTLTSRSWSVVAVDTANDYFELSGDVTARFAAGETFEVSGSTGNDGTYTVSSVVYDEGGNTNTRVYTSESIGDSTADGSVDLAAVRYYSGSDETQLQTSESIGDSTVDGDVEMWKGTAYASANWAA